MNNPQRQPSVSLGSWFNRAVTRYTLVGILFGLLFPLGAAIMKAMELGLALTPASLLAAQSADRLMWVIDTAPLFLGMLAAIAGRREDLHLEANRLLRGREAELDAIRQNLEGTVSERARQLDARNAQLRSVVTFARQLADIQDPQTLVSASVRMISERFERASVDLFLLDETRQSAVLRASSAPAGNEGLQIGHRLAVNNDTPVGRVARNGKMFIAPVRLERSAEADEAPSADVSLPLAVRGRVIGVLNARITGPEPGSQSQAEVLQLLADQLAISIENARLVSESRAAIQELKDLGAESTRLTWQRFLQRNSIAYQMTPSGVRPASSFSGNGSSNGLRIPLQLRGQEIGSISVKRTSSAPWTPSERDLMDKLASQVALAVENARLIEETRQRAAQEQLVSEVSARFSRSLDVEALLQAAVREFAALPEVAEATVILKPAGENDSPSRN